MRLSYFFISYFFTTMAIDRVYVDGDYVQFRDSAGDFVTAIHYSEFSYFNDNGDIKFLHRRDGATLYPITSVNFLDVKDASGTPYVTAPQDLDDFLAAFIALLPTVGGGGGGGTAPDIATYDVQYDIASGSLVRVLTIFDPVTNAPTRTFTALDGSPFVPSNPLLVASFDSRFATSNNSLFIDIERRLGNIMTATRIIDENPSSSAQPRMTLTQRVINAGSGGGDIPLSTTPDAQQVQIIALTGTFLMRDSASGFITYPIQTANGGTIVDFKAEAAFGKTLPSIEYIISDGSSVLIIELISYM